MRVCVCLCNCVCVCASFVSLQSCRVCTCLCKICLSTYTTVARTLYTSTHKFLISCFHYIRQSLSGHMSVFEVGLGTGSDLGLCGNHRTGVLCV